jgi:hypothetical protein
MIEASDAIDGLVLDPEFPVLFTAYPEAKRVLDHLKPDLKSFSPGALEPPEAPCAFDQAPIWRSSR